MTKKITLIGCGIFQEEVEHVLNELGAGDIDIVWLEVGLHDNIERLEEVLTETLAAHRNDGDQAPVGLLFGLSCLPTMKDFAKAQGVKVLQAKNCVAAMVGDEKLKELEQNRTLVATPGWVRKMWLGRQDTPLGWKADDYRINFGRYDLILILDCGLNPLTDEEIINCFDLIQVPIETKDCDLDYFRHLFSGLIESVKGEADLSV